MQSEDLAQKLDSILAPYAVKHSQSKGRAHKQDPDQLRTPYQLDRDRVLHSKAFRRLKDKTQVFTPKTGDHFRDRLTHTLEVAQISRSLARNLEANEDLAEVIALAHDLGHTPFGHAGEYALDECAKKHGESFEHNTQSKRIVEFLEDTYPSHPGLNLTFETLEGLQKHQTPYDQAAESFVSASVEAQIVNLADEIAYNNHDLDDGIRSGILKIQDVQQLELWQQAATELDSSPDQIKMRTRYISHMMKAMLQDLIDNSLQKLKEINSLEQVYQTEDKLLNFSSSMRQKVNELRKLLHTKFYMSAEVQKQTKEGQQIIQGLFETYMQSPEKMPQSFQAKIAKGKKTVTIVMDYVSGMTDTYAKIKLKEDALPQML